MIWPRHSPRVARGEADRQHAQVGFQMRTEVGLTQHVRTLHCLHRAGRGARGKPMLGLRHRAASKAATRANAAFMTA